MVTSTPIISFANSLLEKDKCDKTKKKTCKITAWAHCPCLHVGFLQVIQFPPASQKHAIRWIELGLDEAVNVQSTAKVLALFYFFSTNIPIDVYFMISSLLS